MKRTLAQVMVFSIVLSFLLIDGCSSNKQLTKKDFPSGEAVKVCHYETPGIMRSTGFETALMDVITIGAPGGSALLVLGDQYAKARGQDTQAVIPDLGHLVMDKFVARMKKDRPDWPPLAVIEEPLKEDFSEKCTVIEFKVNRVAYGSVDLTRGGVIFERGLDKGFISKGFLSKVTVTMKNAESEVLLRKSYIYLSENFDRGMSLDELEADNFTLLKEEMDFAAEKTAEDFFEYLNGGQEEMAKAKE